MANAPLLGETGEAVGLICPTGRAKYFSLEDWTLKSALMELVKSGFSRSALDREASLRHSKAPYGSHECAPDDRLRASPQSIVAIGKIQGRPMAGFGINALITDIANPNSTLGIYLVPPGSEKNAEERQELCRWKSCGRHRRPGR
jgi:hypothetical protein